MNKMNGNDRNGRTRLPGDSKNLKLCMYGSYVCVERHINIYSIKTLYFLI